MAEKWTRMRTLRSLFDFACVACPKVAGGLCMVLFNWTLMGVLGPDRFGIFSLCLMMILLFSEGLLGAAIDLGVLRCGTLYRDTLPRRTDYLELTGLRWKLAIGGGLGICLVVLSAPLGRLLFHRWDAAHLIWIVAAAAMASLLHGSALVHLQVRERFPGYGVLDGAQMLLKFGGMAAIMYALPKLGRAVEPGHLVIWFAIAPLATFLGFLATSPGRVFRSARQLDQDGAQELWTFVRWNLLTFALTSLVSRADLLMLTSLSTLDEVGIFAGGQTLASIPQLIGTYLAVVLGPKVMPYHRAGRLYPLLIQVQCLLGVASALVLVGVYSQQDLVLSLVLPTSFAPSATVILILLPAALASMSTIPLVVTFLLFVRPAFLIVMECILLPFVIAAYCLLIPRHGATGAAIVTSAFILLKSVIALAMTFRWARLTHSACAVSSPGGQSIGEAAVPP